MLPKYDPPMYTIEVPTSARRELVPITGPVRDALAEVGLQDGALLVASPHTTCGVTINEGADPDVRRDISTFLAELVPRSYPFRHAEGNSDAHVLVSLVGSSVLIPVEGGRLRLGRWQEVFLAEFDGPRHRNLWITPLT